MLHGCAVHESKDVVPIAGDRTKDSLLSFVETLVPSAGRPHYYVRYRLPTSCPVSASVTCLLSIRCGGDRGRIKGNLPARMCHAIVGHAGVESWW